MTINPSTRSQISVWRNAGTGYGFRFMRKRVGEVTKLEFGLTRRGVLALFHLLNDEHVLADLKDEMAVILKENTKQEG